MRLKSHESPRRQGRNYRGRGGTARKRQINKRNRALLQRLQQKEQGLSSRSSWQAQLSPAFFLPQLVFKGSQPTVSAT